MQKIYFITILIFSVVFKTYSQPAIQWQKCFGGTDDEVANSIQQTSDHGYIVAGTSFSNDGDVTGHHSAHDYWIVKLDSAGALQWQHSYGGTGEDEANVIRQTADGGYIVAGTTSSNDGDVSGNHSFYGSTDMWIVKIDPFGNIEWQKCYGGSTDEHAYDLIITNDGGYIVAGDAMSNDSDLTFNHGGYDCWIVKLNSSGAIIWQNNLGGSQEDDAKSIQQAADGGYVITGDVQSNDGNVTFNHGNTDIWIAKLDASGALIWEKSVGGSDFDFASAIKLTEDGGYIISGFSISNDGDVSGNHGGFGDGWVIKLDSTRSIEWQICMGGSLEDEASNIIQTTDHSYLVTGYSTSSDGTFNGNHSAFFGDCYCVKLNSSGQVLWTKNMGGSFDESGNSLLQSADGSIVIAGSTDSNDGDVSGLHAYDSDFWIVKLSAMVNVYESIYSIQNLEISPNPFSDYTTISLNLFSSDIELTIYDVEGREVKKINAGNGNLNILWDGRDENGNQAQNGIYIVKAITLNHSYSKMISLFK